MRMPDPIWKMIYSSDRRKHSHRCRVCAKIVKQGEVVFMARVMGKKTQVIHETPCSEFKLDGMTHYELLKYHGMMYLAACGFSEAKKWLEQKDSEFRARS